MLEQEKDWTALPMDLIQIIAKKLPDLLDFVRFRATSKTWRFSVPLSDSPPQFPWFIELLKREYNRSNGNLSERQRFYSVSSGQTITIHLAQSESWSRNDGGVFCHYLHLCEDTLSFLNPLTNDRFSFPQPCLGTSNPCPCYDTSNPCPCLDTSNPWIIWTGTDPIHNRSIVVVDQNISLMNEDEIGIWACYDPHNNKWVEQKGELYSCCYFRGMFFSTFPACTTEVFDTSSKKLLHKIPPPEDEVRDIYWFDKGYDAYKVKESFLVESLGIILRVSWFNDYLDRNIVEDSIFHIYRLDFDGLDGQPCWVRADNIGNQILLLQETTGFSMTARPSTGFREGCIYFINPDNDKPYVHDILAGTVERVPCPLERCTWFIPSIC